MTYSLDTLNDKTGNKSGAEPGGTFRHEALLLAMFALLAFVLLAMLSYNRLDPAWSTSGQGSGVRNLGGKLGAYLADLGLFLFGISVWWLVFLGLKSWLSHLRRWLAAGEQSGAETATGFAQKLRFPAGLLSLMLGSAGLEWSRLYSLEARLPGYAGGLLGYYLGDTGARYLGATGYALLSIALLLVGMAMSFGFSWASVSERLGAWVMGRIHAYQAKKEVEADMAFGERAAQVRAQEVQVQREDVQEHHPEPVFIEPVVVDVPKSERVAKERQKPLFADMLDSKLPQVDLLDAVDGRSKQETVSAETLEMTSRLIEKKLSDFGVKVRVVAAAPGPVITRYEIEPDVGVKGSQIVNLARDLARSLSLVSVRVVETIPGKNLMALELPNAKRQTIKLSEILGSQVYNDAKSMLTMGLGKDIIGNPVVADLAKMPHCLVAGTTGSGKSVGINAMILSLLYKAEARDVRLLLIDPKMLEMSVYEGIPHLLAPVVTDMRQAAHGLNWCVAEMERRYKLLSKLGVRNLAGYNNKIDEAKAREEFIYNPFSLTPESPEPLERLPHIVVVIDELADLMMVVGKKIEELIARLAQKARAAGIHLILATQRPSV
ncbi:MAG: hypothetical protein RLZZ271_420, partial [Pseudomonadota bacterium]